MEFSLLIRRHYKQGIKFILCGLLGACLEFLILYVLVGRLGITPVFAYIFSGGVPAIFVFFFNRHVTFRVSTGDSKAQSRRFLLVYTLTFTLNYCLSSFLYLIGLHFVLPLAIAAAHSLTPLDVAYAAKILAIGMTAVVNYTFSHLFIFKKEPVPLESQLAVF